MLRFFTNITGAFTKFAIFETRIFFETRRNQVKQKLTDGKPQTLARASRMQGVTPAAVSLLLIYLKKHGLLKKQKAVL